MALTPTAREPAARRALAFMAVALALVVAHTGPRRRRFARMVALARLARQLGRRPVDEGTALSMVRAVDAVGRLVPLRVACLERTTAAVTALAACGWRAHWCHGVAPDPVRLHAWMETDTGARVGEPPDVREYTRTLRIGREPRSQAWTVHS
ncbi:lasso peptide biosynthesis B2 protein [Streptomyces sp. NPDC092296]|uniref:lasso peptide biosynthesis B2 protein n=1 Tax=Streptomyces sp. NPDC092296 TaxID=3366012 RepID=UPI0038013C14